MYILKYIRFVVSPDPISKPLALTLNVNLLYSNMQSGLLKAIELGSSTTLEDLQELQKNCYGAKIAFCSVHHQSPISAQCGGDVSIIFFNAIVGFIIGSYKIGVFRTAWETIRWIDLPR